MANTRITGVEGSPGRPARSSERIRGLVSETQIVSLWQEDYDDDTQGPSGVGDHTPFEGKERFFADLGMSEAYWKRANFRDFEQWIDEYWAYRNTLNREEAGRLHREINRLYFSLMENKYHTHFLHPRERWGLRRKHLIRPNEAQSWKSERWFRVAGAYVHARKMKRRAAEHEKVAQDIHNKIPLNWLKNLPKGPLKSLSDEDRRLVKFIRGLQKDYRRFVWSYENEDHIVVINGYPIVFTLKWFLLGRTPDGRPLRKSGITDYWPKPLSDYAMLGPRTLLMHKELEAKLMVMHGPGASAMGRGNTWESLPYWVRVGVSD